MRLSSWFCFLVVAVSGAASAGGCAADSCAQLSDQCSSCSVGLRAQCDAVANTGDANVCSVYVDNNSFAACEGNVQGSGVSVGAGQGTASGTSGACGTLQQVCNTCNTHDLTQNSLKASCQAVVNTGLAQACQANLTDNAFGLCGRPVMSTTGVGGGSSTSSFAQSSTSGVGGFSTTGVGAGAGSGSGSGAGSGVGGGSSTSRTTTTTSSSVQSSSGAGGAPPSCSGDAPTGDTTCDLCVDNNCCVALTPCLDTTAPCGQFEQCLLNGGTEAACNQAVPGGSTQETKYFNCAKQRCATACANELSQICTSGITTKSATCDTCMGNACCAAWMAVGQNPNGLADYNSCPTDSTCGGDTDAADAYMCFTVTCASECM